MALILTDDQNYKNIATAIREKNGSTTTYAPSEMAAAVEGLSGSGALYMHSVTLLVDPTQVQSLVFVSAQSTKFTFDSLKEYYKGKTIYAAAADASTKYNVYFSVDGEGAIVTVGYESVMGSGGNFNPTSLGYNEDPIQVTL